MSIDADLYLKLTTDFANEIGNRVYPLVAPPTFTTPLIVYQGQRNPSQTFDGQDDITTHMQVDVYSLDYDEVQTIALAVEASLNDWKVPKSIYLEQSMPWIDDTVEPYLYRVTMKWVIVHAS
jgi:hypothetical protein